MNDATIIYYSSNREDPKFEAKIQAKLLENSGGLPIISVTHKPTNLGINICVGDVGVSGFNMFRQVLIACEAATTPFVISAEADCLYPPDYFMFRPAMLDRCFRNSNLYVMPDRRDFFFHKPEGATHAQIVGREFYIKTLKKLFEGAPQWSAEEKNFPKERIRRDDVFSFSNHFKTRPVIQFKTHKGMRYYTNSVRVPITDLPYWGNGKFLRQVYL